MNTEYRMMARVCAASDVFIPWDECRAIIIRNDWNEESAIAEARMLGRKRRQEKEKYGW